jgi:hypothetical protein
MKEEEEGRMRAEEERMNVGSLAVIVIFLLAMTGMVAYGVWVWVRKYREPYGFDKPDILKEPPYLDPPGMAGALVDRKVEMRHILATIVDLARRGIIAIEEVGAGERDYVIRFIGGASVAKENREIEERLEHKAPLKVHSYELKLINALFEGKPVRRLSELKDKFYTRIPEIKASLWNALVEAGWVVTYAGIAYYVNFFYRYREYNNRHCGGRYYFGRVWSIWGGIVYSIWLGA